MTAKTEEKLNEIIFRLLKFSKKNIDKITPKPFKNFIADIEGKIKLFVIKKKQMIIFSYHKRKKKVLIYLRQQMLPSFVKFAQKTLNQLMPPNLNKNLALLNKMIKENVCLSVSWVKLTIKKRPIIVATVIIACSSIIVYGNTLLKKAELKKLAQEEEKMFQEFEEKPDYVEKKLKNTSLMRLELPVYSENDFNPKTVYVELTIEASNQVIILYVKKYEHIITDEILTNLSPITASLAFEGEGKNVILEKIKDELNKTLKKVNIRGEVERVYIESIVEI